MKLSRVLLTAALLGVLVGAAYVSQKGAETPGQKMTRAGRQLLESLTKEQKAKAIFSFDSKERTNWYFVPREGPKGTPTRKGLPLKEMTAEQKKIARDLVAAGTSASGNKQANTIMSLEAILNELEKGKGPTRDPEWYFFTVFGSPSKTGKWGWRVEGHHLSLNFTLHDSKLVSATPFFFGANPALVKGGERKGLETLPNAEKLALKLFNLLDKEQKKAAYREKSFPEPQQATASPKVGPATGLSGSKMNAQQRETLQKLVEAYARRMPADIAEEELSGVRKHGLDNVHFAFTGTGERGKGHTYRVQGPTFVIEFLNTQPDSAGNPANHIHSAWRRIQGDFGLPGKE
jgi:hypothetical protein